MAETWREERPDAITAASHREVRPSRSMVTIFSALSSSSEVRMRFNRSLGGAGFFAGGLAAGLGLGAFLAGGFLDFFAGTFLAALAAGFLPAAFLAILRVRAEILCVQETRFSMASGTAPPARSLVELSAERGPSSTTR